MTLGLITNGINSGQLSMIGYGKLMLKEMTDAGFDCREFRMTSSLSNTGKPGRNLDRFVVTPLKFAGRRADIVHAIDPGSAAYFPLVRAGRRSVTVHDMIPFLAAAGQLDGFKPSRPGALLMRNLVSQFQHSDGIVAVSHSTQRDLVEIAGVDPDRIHVIPNALFQDLHRTSQTEIQEFIAAKRLPKNKPLILNIGRSFYKNRLGVVEIFARLRKRGSDAHLVFVSPSDQTLINRIARLGLSDYVSFLDHVAAVEMPALYSSASTLLFPSLYEGFGYPVLEAQMCGTPVVCSSAGALAEVAGNSAAVFDVADTDGMVDALIRILEDGLYAKQLVQSGYKNLPKYGVSAWRAAYVRYFSLLCGAIATSS